MSVQALPKTHEQRGDTCGTSAAHQSVTACRAIEGGNTYLQCTDNIIGKEIRQQHSSPSRRITEKDRLLLRWMRRILTSHFSSPDGNDRRTNTIVCKSQSFRIFISRVLRLNHFAGMDSAEGTSIAERTDTSRLSFLACHYISPVLFFVIRAIIVRVERSF